MNNMTVITSTLHLSLFIPFFSAVLFHPSNAQGRSLPPFQAFYSRRPLSLLSTISPPSSSPPPPSSLQTYFPGLPLLCDFLFLGFCSCWVWFLGLYFSQVYSGLEVFVDEVQEMEELDSLVEISETRTLPSALSYRNGVEKIREEVENLKANPPSSASGVLRLQVYVFLFFVLRVDRMCSWVIFKMKKWRRDLLG